MKSNVSFPLFVFEKDDYSMFMVETPDKILDCMEPIDIESGEYLCWDANGRGVRISVSGQRVTGICHGEPEILLAEALRCYSEVYGLDVDTAGPLNQVWPLLKETEGRLPRRHRLLSRLFSRIRA
jgi:hypothetical protein